MNSSIITDKRPFDYKVLAENFQLISLKITNRSAGKIHDFDHHLTAQLDKFEINEDRLNLHLIINCPDCSQPNLSVAGLTRTSEPNHYSPDIILLGKTQRSDGREIIQLLPTAEIDFEQEFKPNEAWAMELFKQLIISDGQIGQTPNHNYYLLSRFQAFSKVASYLVKQPKPLWLLSGIDNTQPTLVFYSQLKLSFEEILIFHKKIPSEHRKFQEIIPLTARHPEIQRFLDEFADDIDPITYCSLMQILNRPELELIYKNHQPSP